MSAHTGTRPQRGRPPSAARNMTYVLLVITVILSAFPIYWTFVVASSTNDIIADVPNPTHAPSSPWSCSFHHHGRPRFL